MTLAPVSKALAGGLAAALAGTGGAAIAVPDAVAMPWWGYLAVGLANALMGFLAVYLAPANRAG